MQSEVTEAGRHALAGFAEKVLRLSPPLLQLDLMNSGFNHSDLGAIRDALVESSVRTFRQIRIRNASAMFDTDRKC